MQYRPLNLDSLPLQVPSTKGIPTIWNFGNLKRVQKKFRFHEIGPGTKNLLNNLELVRWRRSEKCKTPSDLMIRINQIICRSGQCLQICLVGSNVIQKTILTFTKQQEKYETWLSLVCSLPQIHFIHFHLKTLQRRVRLNQEKRHTFSQHVLNMHWNNYKNATY